MGPAFSRMLQTTTRGFADTTTGPDLTRYYNLGLRAFWHPVTDSGFYVLAGPLLQMGDDSVLERRPGRTGPFS
jgi:hypothetical protein